ncbi:MAG: YtxH domain-containing protein [Nitrospiraceae bacterium]
MNESSNNWSSFVAGLCIGAGIAFLLAPQSGAQLRRSIRDYAEDARDQLDDAVERGRAAWDSAVEHGQDYVERGADVLHETVTSASDQAQRAAGRAARAARARV